MAFWSDPNTSPKMSFRWYASFGSGENQINQYTLRTFTKPSFEIAQNEYIWLNDIAYRPGLLAWNPIEITITDVENHLENNTRKLYNLLRGAGYQSGNVNKPQSAIEKKRASQVLGGDMRITQLDHSGTAIEEWQLINPFITQINFGQSSYANEELVTISLNIRYDRAKYNSLIAVI